MRTLRTLLFTVVLLVAGIVIGVMERNEVSRAFANLLLAHRSTDRPHEPSTDQAMKTARLDEMLISKGVTKGDPVFIRIFKAERELDLWMRKAKRFTLVKTQCH